MRRTPDASRTSDAAGQQVQAVAFDWGGTVMEDPGVEPGPMALWRHVAAVEGVAEAIDRLAGSYRLGLATNADDSGADLVEAALARVGLADRFEVIVASCEIGYRKPDAAFFAALADRLGCPADAIVMVGDDYAKDVAGARAAGLRAIWFDRERPTDRAILTLHDARITCMRELPAAVERLSVAAG